MSTFFKAFEHAERERALQKQARSTESAPEVAEPPQAETSRKHFASAPSPLAVHLPAERISRRQTAVADRSLEAGGLDGHLVSLLAPASPPAQQYQALRHAIEQLHKAANTSVVAVSSPSIGDGKTITAINLAGSLAQALEARVLLVDADLRRPSVADHLLGEASDGRGLVDAILDSGLSLVDVIRERPPFNVAVLSAGRPPAAPYELLKSARLERLLEEARQDYDYIVVDTPPLVPVLDCRVIEKWVDGFLVVVRAHKTSRRLLEEALKVLDPAKLMGLVFNGDDTAHVGDYYYASGSRRERGRAGLRLQTTSSDGFPTSGRR